MNLKTVIVEDEARALSLLVDYVSKVPYLTLSASFQDSIQALDFLNNHKIG
ncbi:hypothetical protein [Pseudoalteromonas tetraodonis]|uniref:hypothetical protein n=1 Tax=Pseudoalteromonas tetraodonis TaxID=43659 RepID=UPI003A97B8B7